MSEEKKTNAEDAAKEVAVETTAAETTSNENEETTTTVSEEPVAEETKVESVEESVAEEVTPEAFDWDGFTEDGLATYSKDQYKELETMYDATLPDETQAGVIDGTIINLTDREAIIEIGGKSEGVISLNEFRYNPELAVGDTVEVLIDQQ